MTSPKKKAALKLDRIAQIEQRVSAMSRKQATKRIFELVQDGVFTNFEKGRVLTRIRDEAWYGRKGGDGFKLFAILDLHMEWPDVQRLIRVSETIKKVGLTEEELKGVSWSAMLALYPFFRGGNSGVEKRALLLMAARSKSVTMLQACVKQTLGQKLTRAQAAARIKDGGVTQSQETAEYLLDLVIRQHVQSIRANKGKTLSDVDKCAIVLQRLGKGFPEMRFLFWVDDRKGQTSLMTHLESTAEDFDGLRERAEELGFRPRVEEVEVGAEVVLDGEPEIQAA